MYRISACIIFKYQRAIKKDLGAMFNPDYIFTPGKVSKYLLEKVRLVPNKHSNNWLIKKSRTSEKKP